MNVWSAHVGREAGGHEQDPVQGQLVECLFGGEKVAVVDGIKGTAQDAQPHDTLLCVQTSSLINQQKRMRLSDNSYYLKSLAEMRAVAKSSGAGVSVGVGSLVGVGATVATGVAVGSGVLPSG